MNPLHVHHEAVLRRLVAAGAVSPAAAHAAEGDAARARAAGRLVTPVELLIQRGLVSRASAETLARGESRRRRRPFRAGLLLALSAVSLVAVVWAGKAVLARKALVEQGNPVVPTADGRASSSPKDRSPDPVAAAPPREPRPPAHDPRVPPPAAEAERLLRERIARESAAEEEYRRAQEHAESARRELLARAVSQRDSLLQALRAEPDLLALSDLRRRATELADARQTALAAIHDSAVYTYDLAKGDHGARAQPDIDRLVAVVRERWRFRHDRPVRLNAALRPRIEAAREAERDVIAAGGEASLDLSEYEMMLAAIDAPIDVAGFWGSSHERARLRWNAAVRTFNRDAVEEMHPSERKQVELVNDYREMLGLHALEIHPALWRAARGHSERMLETKHFSHEEHDETRRTLSRRVALEGFQGVSGENISFGPPDPQAAFQAWYTSSEHHRNMLDPIYIQIGVGKAKLYWTQNFGRSEPQVRVPEVGAGKPK